MADSKKRPPIPASTRKRPKAPAASVTTEPTTSRPRRAAAAAPTSRGAAARGVARTTAEPAPAKATRPASKGVAKPPRKTAPRADVPEPSEETRAIALAAAAAGLEKKAVGVEILDVTGRVDYADFLVVMTGRSNRQVDSIAQAIIESVERKQKRPALSVEGLPAAVWVLIDFGDVVVHVFQEDARTLYDIEGLWLDAKRLPVPEGADA